MIQHFISHIALLVCLTQISFTQCLPEYSISCKHALTGANICMPVNDNLDYITKCRLPINICVQERYEEKPPQATLLSAHICPHSGSDIFGMLKQATAWAANSLWMICINVQINVHGRSDCPAAGQEKTVVLNLITDNYNIFKIDQYEEGAKVHRNWTQDPNTGLIYTYTDRIWINGTKEAMDWIKPSRSFCFSTDCLQYNVFGTSMYCKNLTTLIMHELLHIIGIDHITDCMDPATYPWVKNEVTAPYSEHNVSSGLSISSWLCCAVRAMYCPGMGKISNDPCPDPTSVASPRIPSLHIPTILAYPNPATHSINVVLFSQCVTGVLTVYSENGEVIEERRISDIYDNNGSLSIDTQRYISGVYYIVFSDSNGIGAKRVSIVH